MGDLMSDYAALRYGGEPPAKVARRLRLDCAQQGRIEQAFRGAGHMGGRHAMQPQANDRRHIRAVMALGWFPVMPTREGPC